MLSRGERRTTRARRRDGRPRCWRQTEALRVLMLWSLFGCVVVGAAIGWHASLVRGQTRASGLVSGALWGPLAVLMYFFDWPYLVD